MKNYYNLYESCTLCPHECRIDRLKGETGICGQTARPRIAAVLAHFGEEPPISGQNGSGTIFFSGCNLKCHFCQNFQISWDQHATIQGFAQLEKQVQKLLTQGVHNINLVTSDHFLPHILAIKSIISNSKNQVPLLFNTSSYLNPSSLHMLEDIVDIYLPDYKFAQTEIAISAAQAANYPEVALKALKEMVYQKGFLAINEQGLAEKGVLVRHLILPGQITNSLQALKNLYREFGPQIPLSVMAQYYPARPGLPPPFNRPLTWTDYQPVYDLVQELGFNNLFLQYPQAAADFVPDFSQKRPFKGNKS
jgi:putative pyruvate formate lyase activating enzyme